MNFSLVHANTMLEKRLLFWADVGKTKVVLTSPDEVSTISEIVVFSVVLVLPFSVPLEEEPCP
jgi:hypothetical protein